MRKFLFLLSCLFSGALFAQTSAVVINEINADNPGGTDTREFIELFGPANGTLDSLVVVFFDGATGLSYNAFDLDGYTLDAQGFFVMGNALTTNVDLVFANASMQNGADAVALYWANATDFPNGTVPTGTNLIDGQVYGTADPAATNLITGLTLDVITPGYAQFDETAQTTGTDLTQSKIPDGAGPNNNANYVLQTLTPGTWNQPPCVGGTIALTAGGNAFTSCNNVPAVVDFASAGTTGNYVYFLIDANQNIIQQITTGFDFNGLLPGTYTIKGLAYSGTLNAATTAAGLPASGVTASPCFSWSTNAITVTINACSGCSGATISFGNAATSHLVQLDAIADNITLSNTTASTTATYAYLLSDVNGNLVSIVNAAFDYNTLTAGLYTLTGISYEGTLNASVGQPVANVSASTCWQFSNNTLTVNALVITSVVINEINADNPGGLDTQEFIELYGPANASLTGLTVVFFDGATGISYNAIDLDGYTLDAQGFFVLGNANAVNVDLIFTNGILQNGADAVAIYIGDATQYPNGTAPSGNNLMDAQVYGTADATATNLITGLTLNTLAPGYTQFDETVQTVGTDLTQSRIPDGGAAFAFSTYILQTLTPGTWNQPPCVGGTVASASGNASEAFCNLVPSVITCSNAAALGSYLYVVVDANQNIVQTFDASFDFNGLAVGSYTVHGFAYTGTLDLASTATGAPFSGMTASTCASFSTNNIPVVINVCAGCAGGQIATAAGSNNVMVNVDGNADYINLSTTSASQTDTYVYALIDANGNLVSFVDNAYDFNTLSVGNYSIQGLSYEGTLTAVIGQPVAAISASTCFEFSTNSINVNVVSLPNVVINELNADNPGGLDTQEFIELYGPANLSLDSLVMVFYDGATGVSYQAFDLDGYSLDAQGFFVMGNANATNVDLVFTNGILQNGADAIALYLADAVDFPNGTAPTAIAMVDAQVYGTADATATNLITGLTLDVMVPGYAQFDETAQVAGTDLTQSRIPDGGTPYTNASYVLQTLTPGTWNQPPCNGGTISLLDNTTALTICDNLVGVVQWNAFNGLGNSQAVVSNAAGEIVALPSANQFDFTGMTGVYNIQFIGYTNAIDPTTAQITMPISGIMADQCTSVSANSITVDITVCSGCNGATVSTGNGSNAVSVISDANADVLGLNNTTTSLTATYVYALTDANGLFIQWVDGTFDFNTLATGSYLVSGLSYEGALTSPAIGAAITTASATTCLEWSTNSIAINVMTIANVVINELNADNPGGVDTQEFIEFYGDANAPLDGLVMVFYDGATGLSYAAHDLDGYSTDANGFFVMGDAAATAVSYVIPNASIQNGADAIALYVGNGTDFPNGTAPVTANLIDAMVYGTGDATATNLITGLGLDILFPGYAQFDETVQTTGIDLTQSRVPDGGPALTNTNVVLQALTPGTYNVVILGCMDTLACNYNSDVTVDDGSCTYPGGVCDDGNANTINDMLDANCICVGIVATPGCMDITACNYSATATVDDGSCLYPGGPCDDGDPTTVTDIIDINCLCNGTTPLTIPGCMNVAACNYNSAANTDDGSCILPGDPCDDGNAATINDVIDANCGCSGTLVINGCTDATACNYDATANADDGSCIHPGDACDDGNPSTINDVYDANCVCAGTLVGVEENEWVSSLRVYPNPTKDVLNIRWTGFKNEVLQVQVFNIAGQKVDQFQWVSAAGENQHQITTTQWKSGFYILEWQVGDNVSRAHVIKE